mgnify:CR=1 FL=1
MLSDESTAKFEIELVNKQVQKIKQAKKDCQTHYGKQLGCGICKALQLCMWIDELVDTIEAMRKHIEALQQENEQLRAQVAQYRDALKEIFKLLEEHEPIWYLRKHYNLITVALSDTPADYHNPADVAVLKQAREALNGLMNAYCVDYNCPYEFCRSSCEGYNGIKSANKALAAIDNAIGGKEDV